MHIALAIAAAIGATSWSGHEVVGGSLDLSVTVIDPATLTADAIDLGGGVASYVATYTHGDRNETLEVLAMRGDCVDFTAGERLAVRRYRRDGWPKSDEAIALLARR